MTVNMEVHVKSERVDDQCVDKPSSVNTIENQGNINHQHIPNDSNATTVTKPHGPIQGQNSETINNTEEDKPKVSENEIDYSSFKGVFGWTTIDGINVPYIFRKDRKFMPVRIVEQKLLSRYPNAYPDELGKHQPLTSYLITEHEAKLINEINLIHCGGEFGTKAFHSKDLIVVLEDFCEFYNLVKKTFPGHISAATSNNQSSCHNQRPSESCGWIQVNNTVTPFVWKSNSKFVPLSVMKHAAMLDITDTGILPSTEDCELLNKACIGAGFKFVFSKTTRLVSLKELLINFPVHVTDLPSVNPLEYAQYLEFQQAPNVSDQFQQNHPNKPNFASNHHQPQISEKTLQQLPPDVRSRFSDALRGRQKIHQAFLDPRNIFSYNRFPHGSRFNMPNGPPNVTVNQIPSGNTSKCGPRIRQPPPAYQHNAYQPNKEVTRFGPEHLRKSPVVRSLNVHDNRQYSNASIPNQRHNNDQLQKNHNQHVHQNGDKVQQAHNLQHQARKIQQQAHNVQHQVHNVQHQVHNVQHQAHNVQQQAPNVQRQANETGPGPRTQMQIMYPMRALSNKSARQTNGVSSNAMHRSIPPPPNMSGPHQTATGTMPSTNTALRRRVQENINISKSTRLGSNTYQQSHPNNSVRMTDVAQSQSAIANNESFVIPGNTQTSTGNTETSKGNTNTSTVNAKPSTNDLIESIHGVWLSGKSISCMHLNNYQRSGKFCLVEAVCKLYFSGCSVNEFLFALENVLNVPLLACSEEEEKAFIKYYSLPVTVLKCNKMIDFDELDKFFPQLSYVFKEKCSSNENKMSKDTVKTKDGVPPGSVDLSGESASQSSFVGNNNTPRMLKRKGGTIMSGKTASKQLCRKLEATVQRLLNQQEHDPCPSPAVVQNDESKSSGGSVIVLD